MCHDCQVMQLKNPQLKTELRCRRQFTEIASVAYPRRKLWISSAHLYVMHVLQHACHTWGKKSLKRDTQWLYI